MGTALPQVVTSDRASGAQVIDGSLKFKRDSSSVGSYLSRTPSSGGSGTTFTMSAWVKRSANFSEWQRIFAASPGSSDISGLAFRGDGNTDGLRLQNQRSGYNIHWTSNGKFRDCNGWYHIVMSIDLTLGSGERQKIYINGIRDVGSYVTGAEPTSSQPYYFNNSGTEHRIGSSQSFPTPFDGYMSQFYWIDGQALGPENFGYTDPLTNTWRPKKYTGDFSGPASGLGGVTWSSLVSGPVESSYPLSNCFSGTIGSGYTNGTRPTVGNTLTLNIASLNLNVTNVRLNSYLAVSLGSPSTFTVNGSTVTTNIANGDQTHVIAVNGQLNTIVWSYDNSNGPYVYMRGIEVDLGDGAGYRLLTDGSGSPAGVNGFYLPMDGNSPIGEDKSGQGNNWTPVNFGGSLELDNLNVSGARPILNTGTGGTVARPGVFGSEENLFYTVTTANGSVYQFDITSGDNPSLSFIRGATYKFDYSSHTGHPLLFSTSNPDSSVSAYTDGTSIASNVISFTVPHNAPATLYYYCSNHPTGMNGAISITTDETKADPYAWKNVLALPLVGSANDVSNSVNSGSTTKAITINGSADSDGISNFYGGSFGFVPGSSQYLSTPGASVYAFGTQPFTVEFWYYNNNDQSGTDYNQVIGNIVNVTSGYWRIGTEFANAGEVYFTHTTGSYADIRTGVNCNDGKWHHITFVREGTGSNQSKFYIDGIQRVAGTVATNLTSTATLYLMYSAQSGTPNHYSAGNIQDVRIYNGVAKYTSDFVVPSTSPDILPDTPSGVSGGSKLTISPDTSTEGAVAFDGNSDYLAVTGPGTLAASSNWCIECTFYCTGASSGTYRIMSANESAQGSEYFMMRIRLGQYQFYTSNTNSLTGTAAFGKWTHIAMTKSGTTVRAYVDGVQLWSTTDNNTDSITNLITGWGYGSEYFPGFISNARFVNGSSVYTSNFTPPVVPLTNITNTAYLFCQSNTSATAGAVIPNDSAELNAPLSSVAFADSSTRSKTITNVGSITTASAGSNTFNITNAASFDGSSQRLNLPQTGMTFTGSFTLDTYIKLDSSAANYNIIINTGYRSGSDKYVYIGVDNNDKLYLEDVGTTGGRTTASGAISKNTWYHVRVTQGDGNMKLYANGTLQVTHTTNTFDMSSTGRNFTIGAPFDNNNNSNNFHGLIGPTRYAATNLGAPSAGGEATTGGALSNLSFASSITANGTAAASRFTPFNTDINTVRGQETGYPTWNPLDLDSGASLSNGNLTVSSTTNAWHGVRGTTEFPSSGGKWYFEVLYVSGTYFNVGIDVPADGAVGDLSGANSVILYEDNGTVRYNNQGTTGTISTTIDPGMTFGVAVNHDTKSIQFYIDNILTHSATYTTPKVPAVSGYGTWSGDMNFGQKPFRFPPPDGFQPLNAANVRPETVISRPDQYVGVTTYTGNGTGQSINTGQKPDFVWIKPRTAGNWHNLYDSVRGADKALFSNTTDGQVTYDGRLTSFDPSGFTVGNVSTGGVGTNENARPFVVWSWKAGGSKNTFNVDDVGYASAAAAGLDGGSLAVTGASVGTKQGFSIIKFASGSSGNKTLSHGLLETPTFILVKTTGASSDWSVYHKDLGGTVNNYLVLNTTAANATASNIWGAAVPTSSVFGINPGTTCATSQDVIAYLWHDVPGLQKFGSYTGNGTADNGPFVELGFRPAVILIKRTTTGTGGFNWTINDSERNKYNPSGTAVFPNLSNQESTNDEYEIDFLSNGFKPRCTTPDSINVSGQTYIYAAWAEAPTFNLFGAQSNAR